MAAAMSTMRRSSGTCAKLNLANNDVRFSSIGMPLFSTRRQRMSVIMGSSSSSSTMPKRPSLPMNQWLPK